MGKKKEPAITVDNQEVAAAVNEATTPVNAVIEQESEAEVDISTLQPHSQIREFLAKIKAGISFDSIF